MAKTNPYRINYDDPEMQAKIAALAEKRRESTHMVAEHISIPRHSYQRPLNRDRIEHFRKQGYKPLFGRLTCARRRGSNIVTVVDGQHRLAAQMLIDPKELMSIDIIEDIEDLEQEALLYQLLNDIRELSRTENLHASSVAGNKIVTEFKKVFGENGIPFSEHSVKGKFSGHKSLLQSVIDEEVTLEELRTILPIAKEMTLERGRRLTINFIKVLCYLSRYNDFTDNTFKARLVGFDSGKICKRMGLKHHPSLKSMAIEAANYINNPVGRFRESRFFERKVHEIVIKTGDDTDGYEEKTRYVV